jgi:hypothetical protein
LVLTLIGGAYRGLDCIGTGWLAGLSSPGLKARQGHRKAVERPGPATSNGRVALETRCWPARRSLRWRPTRRFFQASVLSRAPCPLPAEGDIRASKRSAGSDPYPEVAGASQQRSTGLWPRGFFSRRMFYRITSSAIARSVSGMPRSSALAVSRLMTSSNFVGKSTGRSLGLAPFKILST